MNLDTTTVTVDPAPATQQDALVLLLQDRERVTAQFVAIMTTSGFNDRVIVGTLPGRPHDHTRHRAGEEPRRYHAMRTAHPGIRVRVRSPPGS